MSKRCKFFKQSLMIGVMAVLLLTSANAEVVTIWDKATEIMTDLYDRLLLISTLAAIVTAAFALVMMYFSRNGRTVDESRAWLKRIIIVWVLLNSLGFIMAYVTPFFADGKWTVQ